MSDSWGFGSGFPFDDDFFNDAPGADSGSNDNGGFSSGGDDDFFSSMDGFGGMGKKEDAAPGKERILVIAREKTFMVNAIMKSLTDENYDALFARAVISEVDLVTPRPRLVVFYVDNADRMVFETLTHFRDIIAADIDAAELYLVGNENEIEDAYSFIPRDYTRGTFPRPLNVKSLVEKLRMNHAFNTDDGTKRSILVVDDDPIMLRTLKSWLSGRYHVFMANSGANAIALLARNHADLVLLDYEMPVISGDKVLEMIRSEPLTANVPVMFLTAKDDKETVLSVTKLRPVRYLLKTMPPNDLLRCIDDFFRKQAETG